jgi:lincosamide nucleotidyltransferase A/C/D/E
MMIAADAVGILGRLDAAGIATWVDGGWGVDALVGEQTRAHEDLDLVVRLDDVPLMIEILTRDGFDLVRGVPDSNFVLRDGSGREVDIHPARFDKQGNGIYRMENGEDWVYPASALAGRGTIAGRQVQCLTADFHMISHSQGYVPGATDFHDMALLHDRFGTRLLPPFDGRSPSTTPG